MTVDALPDVLARAEAAEGDGPEAFSAVLEATLAASRTGPELARPFVTRLWFTPWRFDPGDHVRARESAWLAPTRPVALAAAGRRLEGFVAGTGRTVLLVHGWGDYAARLGAFVGPLLDRGFRVLGIDLPGHGGSRGGPVDLYEWANALTAVIEKEDVEAVVAHSLGAQATVRALRSTGAVRGAALLAPAIRLEHSVDAFTKMFSLPDAAVDALRQEIDARYGSIVWYDTAGDVAARQLHLPALVIHSDDDDQIAPSDGRRLADAWPGATFVPVQGLGHTHLLRDPATIDAVASFLAETVPAG